MTGPSNADEGRTLQQLIRRLPGGEISESVGAGDEEPLDTLTRMRSGELNFQIGQGVDRVGVTAAIEIHGGHGKVGESSKCRLKHAQAMIGRGDVIYPLMPGLRGRREQDGLQIE